MVFPLDNSPQTAYNDTNFIATRKAMKRTSNVQQQHTESSRLMRGAWKTGHEYIFELHTKRLDPVGCDGFPHTLSC